MTAEEIDPRTVRFYDKSGKELTLPQVRKQIGKSKASKLGASLAPLALAGPEGAALAGAGAVAGKASDMLTGDLVVVHYSTGPRGTKKHPLPPIEYEVHINLAALGIGALTVAGALWLLGLGIGTRPDTGKAAVVKRGRWQGIFLGGNQVGGGGDVPLTNPPGTSPPPPPPGESLACQLCRTLGFPFGLPFCAACAAGL